MRLKLDARARRILRRMPVVNVYSVVELALLAGLAVQCARLAWTIVTPITPLGDWRPAAPMVVGSPADILRGFDPFFRLGGVPGAPATVTSLQLTLFGTRMDEAMGRSSAIIAGPDGVQQSVAIGDEIQPGVRLKAVAFDHVTIDRGGVDEDLFLDQSGAVAPVVPGATSAGASSGAAGIPIARLRTEIGFIPRIDGGRISGLTLRSQGSGAAFRAAGLKDGDVLTSIGGRPVTGPGDLDRITKDFAGGGNVPITVERGQDTLSLAITIAPPQ
ncbi:type II secretion system protein N [Sphingomonas sp. LB2R24]|uniref:type II secretion system protein N n=1 Tax=Sphingomonas sorbitolis TaxID=3096165 RepID=UPI002FCAD9EC